EGASGNGSGAENPVDPVPGPLCGPEREFRSRCVPAGTPGSERSQRLKKRPPEGGRLRARLKVAPAPPASGSFFIRGTRGPASPTCSAGSKQPSDPTCCKLTP